MAQDVIANGGTPEIGNLATPINSSPFTRTFINALPIYRRGLSSNRRGLEIGMAHGFLLYGPFSILGPLRNTETAGSAGLLATVGLVVILTVCLSLYGNAGAGPSPAESTVTTPNPPQELFTKEGWSEFTSGFILGGLGGAFFAFYLASTPYVQPLVKIAAGVWSVH